ncbi:MAG: UDP-N-acetylglucosamine 2-epimerase (hydrolyzing) [Bacteroidaceae bacterium]|nr:UDP-N-acetylglucosamine 2-epimerase (hydrolyzing) [Bacteroidaceae bacterium]
MKKLLFVTGTRADYGKLKSLMKAIEVSEDFELYIYVSGMHILKKYGSTYQEVLKDNYKNVQVAFGQHHSDSMSYNLGNVICDLTGYVQLVHPDMIVVHGDRIDAMAGAVVGALNNIRVAHIEGGEVSGTIDESIRHAISKFAHFHFVSNEEAKKRLIQLGEAMDNIFVIGSPDIDIMLSENLPSLESAKERYVDFDDYGILMYHPVTTEFNEMRHHIREIVDAVLESGRRYIVIYPNNDLGTEVILSEYERFKDNENIAIFPSIRFEYFLTYLKNASFMIGNSSAGIRETGVYGVPGIDIGSRQKGRYDLSLAKNLQHTEHDKTAILEAIKAVDDHRTTSMVFGGGNSTEKFMEIISKPEVWESEIQKKFYSLDAF